MSAITWTRHEYTPISDATERLAWYTAAGLDEWFDITVDESGSDVFTIQPYTGGAKLELVWAKMNARGSTAETAWEKLSNCNFYLAGASSATTINTVASTSGNLYGLHATSAHGNLSFDFATVGNVELLRLCTVNNTWTDAREMIFARDTTTTVDGSATKLILLNSPYATQNPNPLTGTYLFLPDTTGSTYYSTNSSSTVQFSSKSVTYCDKYILQPIQTLGIISHIYAIDGSPNYAPVGDTEFTLGGHTYYSLGHGICVRVK